MGYAVYYNETHNRDVGYGVPAICDHPKCNTTINRGLAHVCCEQQSYGGERGCGLYFCSEHSDALGRCPRCSAYKSPYKRRKADHVDWVIHQLTDPSWADWRDENPSEVAAIKAAFQTALHQLEKTKK